MSDGVRTPHGFAIGPAEVTCMCEIRGTQVIEIRSDHHRLTVYISPAGRSVRAWLDGDEMAVPTRPTGDQDR